MDLNVRQERVAAELRTGSVAIIDKGESVFLQHEIYPSTFFDKLVSMGLAKRYGKGDDRTWRKA